MADNREGSTMVRLNANIRDTVIQNLLKRKYMKAELELDEQLAKLEEQEKEVAKLAYEAAFEPSIRKFLEGAASGMFPEQDNVKVRIEYGPGNYHDTMIKFGDKQRVPYRNSHHGGGAFASVLDGNTSAYVARQKEYTVAETEYHDKKNKTNEQKWADRRRLQTVIESVTTVKRLLEIWPEVQEFLPELVSGIGGGVPAELIASLNKEFGING